MFMIKRLESNTVFGQRTRGEAAGDFVISAILLAAVSLFMLTTNVLQGIVEMIGFYDDYLGIQWSNILVFMQIIAFPLVTIGLFLRVVGDLYEFKTDLKKRATSLIEESGVFLLLALSLYVNAEYLRLKYLYFLYYSSFWYSQFVMLYVLVSPLIFLLAFQVSSSSLKGKLMNRNNQNRANNKSSQTYSAIAN